MITKNKSVLSFKNRLAEVMGDDSVSTFAKKCEMSETVIRDYLSGKTSPSLTRLALIAVKCEVSYCWLATGYDGLDDEMQDEHESIYNEHIHRIKIYHKQVPSIEEAKQHTFVRGTPAVMSYPVLDGWLSFRGLNAQNLFVYWAKGDQMLPEIKNNDGLIINSDMGEIIDGYTYLIEYEDMTLLRKIRLTLDGWTLFCNNDACTEIHVKREDFHKYKVLGHVVRIMKDIL